jgi:hypothetical protein
MLGRVVAPPNARRPIGGLGGMKRVKIALWQWRCAKVVATGKTLSIHVFGQGPSAENIRRMSTQR